LFADAKYKLEIESIGEEGQDDRAFEENLPRRSGRKATRICREEHAHKEILTGVATNVSKYDGRRNKTYKE
jgi:hypothetical protein